MDNLDMMRSREIDHRRHPLGERIHSMAGALAPVVIPHVADQNCGFADGKVARQIHRNKFAAPAKSFHATAQRQRENSPVLRRHSA